MAYYVGLTDDLERRKQEHGNPVDWKTAGPFLTEEAARIWEKQYVGKPGYLGDTGGAGWKYGYWYTVTAFTRQ